MRPRIAPLLRQPVTRRALMTALLSASLIPTLRADYAAEVLSENPIVYYRFDDGVATDDMPTPAANLGSVGAASNGSYVGNFVRGVGGALPGSSDTAAQGSGTIVDIPYSPALNNAGSFSVEVWLKPTAIPTGTDLLSPIASFRENAHDYGRAGWLIYQGNDATGFNFRTYNRNGSNTAVNINSGAGITAGAWHHVVITWDHTEAVGRIYVNGVLKNTSTVVPAGGPNLTTYEPNDLTSFTLGSRAGGFNWSGDIDEPAYYTAALSDAQVLAHYNNGVNPSPPASYESVVLADSPAGYWRLGETTPFVPRTPPVADNVGTLGDSADGGYHAGSKNSASGPDPASGFLGFAPGNSCVALANGHVGTALSLLNNRSAFTVMGWVKRGAVKSTRGGYFGQNDLLEFGDAGNGSQIEAWSSASGQVLTDPPFPFPDDTWGFITYVADGTQVQLYLNGQLAKPPLASVVANYGSSAFPFNIGGGGVFGPSGDYFRGQIDEVAIFDKAVTPGRVQQLYEAAVGSAGVVFVDPIPAVAPAGDIPEGQPFTLSIDHSGTPPFTYVWKRDGVPIPDSNAATVVVTAEANSPITEPFSYTVEVTNAAGTVPSDPAIVYVTPALKWTGTDGTSPGIWSASGGEINWMTFTAGTPAAYADFDYATVFDDNGTATTATLTEHVNPKGVIFENDTKDYTVTGAFSISTAAGGGVVKNGPGTTTIDVDDLFVDKVTVNDGSLKLGSGLVTGLYAGASVAVTGGTLDIGLPTGTPYSNATTVAAGATVAITGTGDLSLAAAGTGFSGAGNQTFDRDGTVVVAMANALGGTVTIEDGTVVFDGAQEGNRLAAGKVVTVSPGAIMEIRGVNALPTAANAVSPVLNQATLNVITGGSAAIGATGTSHAHLGTLTLDASSVVLAYSGEGGVYNGESFQLNGGITVTGTGASTIGLGSGANAGNSGIAISGNATHVVDVANTAVGADLIIAAELENSDASAENTALAILSKTGSGTLRLADGIAHSFTGTTQVNEGTLEATGSLAGPLTVASGAVLAPGASAGSFGAGTTTLGGTYRCEIDGTASDLLGVTGDLVFGTGAQVAIEILGGGVTAPFYEIARCTGNLSGPLPGLTGAVPPGYALQVVSGSLFLAQATLNIQPVLTTTPPSGSDDFETSGGGFTVSTPVSPETDWAHSPGSWLSFGTDAPTGVGTNTTYLTTPIYTVNQAGAITLSFSHKYNFEVDYDAGAVELSVNGGAFTRVPGTAFTENGYAPALLAAGTNSALAGQEGFLALSAGHPAFLTSTATLLATAAVGDTVQVRFMAAYDDAFSAGGWEIDSFAITGALPKLLKLEWPLGIMQYSDTLQPPWTDLTGGSPLLIDTQAAPKRFFRIKP